MLFVRNNEEGKNKMLKVRKPLTIGRGEKRKIGRGKHTSNNIFSVSTVLSMKCNIS